ncbi:MAG: hypothetical protein R6X02_32695 [Enhygromyxa sp.]
MVSFSIVGVLVGLAACSDSESDEAELGGSSLGTEAGDGSGDGDGDGSGDGDGDGSGDGDGDGDESGDGDGDGDGSGDGDGDESGDGDGDGSGDGDGDLGPQWSITHIDYLGPGVDLSVDFQDCSFCDVSDTGPHTLLRFQQDGGWTIWALYVPSGASPGQLALTQDYSGAYATLSANNAELPGVAQGFYFGDANVGTLNLTHFDPNPGGVIAGDIDVTWQKDEVSAHLQASFSAQVP